MAASDLKILIVAGEASGDTHAAKLVRALAEANSGRKPAFFGSAGPKMRDAGVEAVVRADELSVVGLVEILGALPMFLKALARIKAAAKDRKPDVAILVDFPDFNLRLARYLKRLGIPVVYYISPQLWAWRQSRIKIIEKYVDLLITILPFEKAWYDRRGVTHVEYVGSPLAREVHPTRSKEEFCAAHGLDPTRPIVALLPGSRGKEISRVWPVMLAAIAEMKLTRDDVQFIVAAAQGTERLIGIQRQAVLLVEGETYDALNAADTAAVTSGTATLEAGMIGTPMVVVYKTSPLNYALFEPMIDVPHYGLINLIAETRLATELIQHEFTGETLSAEVLRLLQPDVNAAMRDELRKTADKLGHGGASKRAAEAIMQLIRARRGSS